MTRLQLSPHFTVEEFDCHDGTRVPPAAIPALRRWCSLIGEPLRAQFGPVRVASGYRTASYNRSVGGAPRSYHRYDLHHPGGGPSNPYDLAADVVPARGRTVDWARFTTSSVFGSLTWTPGRQRGAAVPYPISGFMHADTGPRRSWGG